MKAIPPQEKKFSGQEILRDLIPLNSLTETRFKEITGTLTIEDVTAGSYLFGEGDRDNRSIYLLDGVINFIDSNGKVTGVVAAGTDPARYPLANQQPRLITGRAATKSVIAYLDSTLLDVMLTLDQSNEDKTVVASPVAGEDWMARMLQSEALIKLTPTDIQKLLQKLESVNVKAGDVIIRQGDEGDYFYIIRQGKCSVTRLASGEGWDVPLAELGDGDCFGEEALVSDAKRNATIAMISDGILMRLSKKDFIKLLKKNLVHYINYDLAQESIREGSTWLDVRLADEYTGFSFDNSINVPLSMIRERAAGLDPEKKYIICCDTGRRSASAAFLLSQRGLDVCVLEGGMNKSVPTEMLGASTEEKEQPDSLKIVDIDTESPIGKSPDRPHSIPCNDTVRELDKLARLQQERDTARKETQAAKNQLVELRQEIADLQTYMTSYIAKSIQLESVVQEAKKAREALTEHIDRLCDQATSTTRRK
ncbi:MAG: cyclic nucleotide-binding domain-containing protein [Gammaproteobacteria bacterium]|nr:cyclic nucleotide-binding domain-containing protein [Gammaproteobacteria bacterium]MDH3888072.1 cyclic nucleotide-binding domain-containing protein [Gammaproteobacteria bacterium]MDH3985432.1 cyclic nucleotide-binding domain-containing protein [Gammaproteobacteria bacterium]